jgi:hypothetical protein
MPWIVVGVSPVVYPITVRPPRQSCDDQKSDSISTSDDVGPFKLSACSCGSSGEYDEKTRTPWRPRLFSVAKEGKRFDRDRMARKIL